MKITYKDGKEENFEGYDDIDMDQDLFIRFRKEDDDDIYIAKDIIAKIE